jgi:hypothetical protein
MEGLSLFPELFKVRPENLRAFIHWILASNLPPRLPSAIADCDTAASGEGRKEIQIV